MGRPRNNHRKYKRKILEKIILDTNILIEILKNNKSIIGKVETFEVHYISEISKMELFYGALNKKELEKLDKFIDLFQVIPLDEHISNKASSLIFAYAKSHNLNIPDGLIAATSLKSNIPLYTLNTKDFYYIDGINLID